MGKKMTTKIKYEPPTFEELLTIGGTVIITNVVPYNIPVKRVGVLTSWQEIVWFFETAIRKCTLVDGRDNCYVDSPSLPNNMYAKMTLRIEPRNFEKYVCSGSFIMDARYNFWQVL